MTDVRSGSIFSKVFDVAIAGSGYAAFAAALHLRRAGRSVLLIGTGGDMVWESGRGMLPDCGHSDDEMWQQFLTEAERRGAVRGRWLDGAIAEVLATRNIVDAGVELLYYARIVGVRQSNGVVQSAGVATKAGLRTVTARQWIDATETGELVGLIDSRIPARTASRSLATITLQHDDWSALDYTAALTLTAWPTERALTFECATNTAHWRQAILTALSGLAEDLGEHIARTSLSHLTIDPVPQYDSGCGGDLDVAAQNVISASPVLTAAQILTLADRFELGVRAAAAAGEQPADTSVLASEPFTARDLHVVRTVETDVFVAGTGTGGAFAALAAAKAGVSVRSADLTTFVGGIGTGGGVHYYYYGVTGGLQRQIDREVRELMNRFGKGPLGDGPFNPWAKMIVLEQLFDEAGVVVDHASLLLDVEGEDGSLRTALVSTPAGVVRVVAKAFIDGTGDGDLCALAGAQYKYGREYDGLLTAYSQSAGSLKMQHGRPRMDVVNFDAGFVDPTDPEDLTRARVTGVGQYLLPQYENLTRPTYIAPLLGLRQGRQIDTEYTLTLDDQVQGRSFRDTVGFTGAHYDTHASDYEFESDEAVFWVWVNRQWHTQIGSEMSYRMLIPRGLHNVWVASRCFGVSQDAHYTTRMQRDIQRVGEAAGYAAAVAIASDTSAIDLPYDQLRGWLERSGALSDPNQRRNSAANPSGAESQQSFGDVLEGVFDDDAKTTVLENALNKLDQGELGREVWWLYKNADVSHDEVLRRISDSETAMVSWIAAGIASMWGEPAAEARLIQAVDSLEYGYGDGYPVGHLKGMDLNPLDWSKVAPNWLCAIALMRLCGSSACLPALERLLNRPTHGLNTLTTVAVTLERLVRNGRLESDDDLRAVEKLIDRLTTVEVAGTVDFSGNKRNSSRWAELAVRGEVSADTPLQEAPRVQPTVSPNAADVNAATDYSWQLYLAISGVRHAMGLPLDRDAEEFLGDGRLLVRSRFAALT